MDNFNLNLLHPDNKRALRSKRHQYLIEIFNLETQQVLFQREDLGGYHRCGTFTEDENVVIYITFDKHWYLSPIINIWDLEKDHVESIFTSHNSQLESMLIAYNRHKQHLVLGSCFDGEISTYDIKKRKVIKHIPSCAEKKNTQILYLDLSGCGEKIAVLREDILTVYNFKTGEKLFSTPLLTTYTRCQFHETEPIISITHSEKSPIHINY